LKEARRGLEAGLKGASSLQTFRPLEGYLRRGVLGTSPLRSPSIKLHTGGQEQWLTAMSIKEEDPVNH